MSDESKRHEPDPHRQTKVPTAKPSSNAVTLHLDLNDQVDKDVYEKLKSLLKVTDQSFKTTCTTQGIEAKAGKANKTLLVMLDTEGPWP